ncbi:MAG: S-adenosylmethionine decarboxylase [Microthrixaceae bacterium]
MIRLDGIPDLAPHIHRQRLVIEGLTELPMTSAMLTAYLSRLAVELDMVALSEPVLHRSDTYGWAGWMHWETSGCHVYAWDAEGFFSVDIYTCKPFVNESAVEFTRTAFHADTIVHRAF